MPTKREADDWRLSPSEAKQTAAAAREAATIGGRTPDAGLDPALRPLAEAGQGVAEGFELAEQELIEAAEHGKSSADPRAAAFTPEAGADRVLGEYGESDHEDSSEVPDATGDTRAEMVRLNAGLVHG